MADVRPGDALDVLIERVVPGGEGLARLGGVVTLVAGALPGDRVRLRVTEASPRLVRGALEDVARCRRGPSADAETVPARAGRLLRRVRLAGRAPRASPGAEDGARPRRAPAARGPSRGGSPRAALARVARGTTACETACISTGRGGSASSRRARTSSRTSRRARSSRRPLLARLPAIREHLRGFGPMEGELWTLETGRGGRCSASCGSATGRDVRGFLRR